jgi:TPR repeat protein
MKPNPLIFLFAFTLLVFFSGFSVVFADDFQNGLDAFLEEDYDTAYKLIAPLTQEQGNAKSKFYMGMMYDEGKGVLQDYNEAIKWYRLSAEQGYVKSQYRLGVMYHNGTEVPQDYKKAFKWLLKSAEQMNLKAQKLIRTNYRQRHKQIAEQGDSYAQRLLGANYYLGLGVTQDYAEAAKWYKKAAEQEDRVAQSILGVMYEKGKGVSKDYVEAYKWFSLSEETGNGRMYKEKIGKRKMTSTQIAEAQKVVLEWTEKYQKK